MKTHLLKIATACVYGFAASPHEVGAPSMQGIIAEIAEKIAEAVRPAVEALVASITNMGASQATEPFPLADLALWLAGTTFVVVAASWLGRSNLAPLR